jgi:hypothetical protein
MNQKMIGNSFFFGGGGASMELKPSRWKVGCTLKPNDLFALDAQ